MYESGSEWEYQCGGRYVVLTEAVNVRTFQTEVIYRGLDGKDVGRDFAATVDDFSRRFTPTLKGDA